MKNIFAKIEELRSNGTTFALCTIVETKGSTPLKKGAKMLVTKEGSRYGTIGGGNLEKVVLRNAANIIELGEIRLFEHNLLQQHGMCCGGTVHVLIETIQPPDKLFIFGSGHVGRALASFAENLDFDVFVIDPRDEELEILDAKIKNRLNLPYERVLPGLPYNVRTFIAVMTYDHQLDREIVAYCMKKPHAYLGMIGSQRKVEITRKMFLSTGLFTPSEIDGIDMPMGFDVRGKNPEEIALGILAKIIEVKNKKEAVLATSTLLRNLEHVIQGDMGKSYNNE